MVREAAAQGLGTIGDRSAIPALEAAAKADAKGKVRKAAHATLAQIRARKGSLKKTAPLSHTVGEGGRGVRSTRSAGCAA